MCAESVPQGGRFGVLALAAANRMVAAIIVNEDIGQIGVKLRTARESAGLVPDDVVFHTRIPRSVIAALEAEDFSSFASPVYARSFLAQYSGFLNVEAHPWLDALEGGAFIPEGTLRTVRSAPDARSLEKEPVPEARGGVFAVLGLLALSCALVGAAIKGYEYLDASLGGKSQERHSSPAVSAPPVVLEKPPEMNPIAEIGEEAPPRAIIVR